MSIRPAAGCKYFLTIRPALSVLHSSVGLAARVGAQAGFATSRTLGCAQAGFATSRTLGCAHAGRLCHVPNVRVRPGRLCHVPNVRVRPGRLCYVLDVRVRVRVRVRVWYRFWFHNCYRFKYVITSNIWCVAAWSDG